MKLIVKRVTDPKFKILFLSDLHAGNRYVDESAHDGYLAMVDERTRIILGGDLHEAKIRRNKGRLSDQIKTPQEQLNYWKDKLNPYKRQIDGAVSGNHEETIFSECELDITGELIDYLNVGLSEGEQIGYDSRGIWLCYLYGNGGKDGHTNSLNIYIKHGHGGAALPGGKLNAATRNRLNVTADIILTGHVHQFTMTPGECYSATITGKSKVLKAKEQWTVTNGSCLKYGGYAEDGTYQAQPIIQTMINVDMSNPHGTRYNIFPVRPGDKI